MTHFVVFAPPFLSHIRAMEALAQALLARGHAVTWVHQRDVGPLLSVQGVRFEAVGAFSHPRDSLQRATCNAARPGGPAGLRRVIHDLAAATSLLCREGPGILARVGAEAVLCDQMEAAGCLVAERMGLPLISVACALPVNREARVPLPVMPWLDGDDAAALQRNRTSARIYDWMMAPHARAIRHWSRALGVAPRETLAQCQSALLQLSQAPASFDFPRRELPSCFHHVGPLRPPAEDEPALVLPPGPLRDRSRLLVFASLGTLQGGRYTLFKRIAKACRALNVQLLLAHCGLLDARRAQALCEAGATWVTDFVPQRAALREANAVITHAGLNTVLDALAARVPILALPIAFDQPGVAARVLRTGVGLRLSPALATSGRLRCALARLLYEPAFGAQCALLGAQLQHSGGAVQAADLIERALRYAPDRTLAHAA